MMGHHERMNCGAEMDALTRIRHKLGWSRGSLKKIKRGFNKRIRSQIKAKLKWENNC